MKDLIQEIAFVLFAAGSMWLAFAAAGIIQSDLTDLGVGCTTECLAPAE